MRAYVGQCRGQKLIAACIAAGLGECTQPNEYPPRRTPWFADNGAFKAWRAGKPFDGAAFERYLARIATAPVAPDFIVAPDLVAQGAASLALSLAWVDRCRAVAPVALVVQDGMTELEVSAVIRRFRGAVRRRVAAVEARDRRQVGTPRARARDAVSRRARGYCEARVVGARDRSRLDRLVSAAVFAGSIPQVHHRSHGAGHATATVRGVAARSV